MKTRLEFQDNTSHKFWEVTVRGASYETIYGRMGASGKTTSTPCATEDEAQHEASRLIAEKKKKGYYEVTAQTQTQPQNGNEAADHAVGLLTEFFANYPKHQSVLELVDQKKSKEAADVLGEGDSFLQMHKSTFGKWRSPRKKPAKVKSSFDYFIKKYATLTWAVAGELDANTFYIGNVTGGGCGVLEIASDFNDECALAKIANNHPGFGFDDAIVFYGGWGASGYIMDTRVTSHEGEHPIYYFSAESGESDMPHETKLNKAMKVKPFGFWLLEKVQALIATLEPQLQKMTTS